MIELCYTCSECPEQLESRASRLRHIADAHQALASIKFNGEDTAVTVRRNAETGMLACPRCDASYALATKLSEHATVCSVEAPEVAAGDSSEVDAAQTKFACLHCPLVFADKVRKMYHYRLVHQPMATVKYPDGTSYDVFRNPDTGLFTCTKCPSTFAPPPSLHQHASRRCTGLSKTSQDVAPPAESTASTSAEVAAAEPSASASPSLTGRIWRCSHCPELVFHDTYTRNCHAQDAHKQACVIKFKGIDAVLVHRDAKTGRYQCPRCPLNCKSSGALHRHGGICAGPAPPANAASKATVTGTTIADVASPASDAEQMFTCSTCDDDVTFESLYLLKNHRAEHHQASVNVKYGGKGAASTLVERDPETHLFHCHRCPKRFEKPAGIRHHAEMCFSESQDDDGDDFVPSALAPHRAARRTAQQLQTKVTFPGGNTFVFVQRDMATGTFKCPRCTWTTFSPGRLPRHAGLCKAPAQPLLPPVVDVDHAALEQLGLLHLEAYNALICVPCKAAVNIIKLAEHWAEPQHEGLSHDVLDARRALSSLPCLPHAPGLLAKPSPDSPAIEALPSFVGHRCVSCDWQGTRIPLQHWNAKHATRPGSELPPTSMPAEMALAIKVQRWYPKAAYFEVDRGRSASAASSERNQASTSQAAPPRQARASSSASSASSDRLALTSHELSTTLAASPSSPAAAAPSTQSSLAGAFSVSRASESASAQPAAVPASVELSASVAAQTRSAAKAASSSQSGSTAKPLHRSARRAKAAERKSRRRARWGSDASDSGFDTASSRTASDADSDWEKRDAGISDEDEDWGDRGVTPDWLLEDEEESDWIYDGDGAKDGDEAEVSDVAEVQAALARREEASDVDMSDWEGPMVVIEVPRESRTKSKARRNVAAREAADDDALHGASPSSSATQASGADSSTLAASLSNASPRTLPSLQISNIGLSPNSLDSSPHRSVGQPIPAQPRSDQALPDQVATFCGSLLSLAASLLTPRQPQQEQPQPQIADTQPRHELEAVANSAACLEQAQQWFVSSAGEQLDPGPSGSSRMPPESTASYSSLTPSSFIDGSTSSHPASSSQALQDPAASLTSALSESPPSSLPSYPRSDKGKQRMLSVTPETYTTEAEGNKRRKLS